MPEVQLTPGPVTTLTLTDSRQLNLLSVEMAEALLERLLALRQQPDLRALVITGSGHKAFCAGANMKQLLALKNISQYVEQGQELMQTLEDFPVPTIAAINGYALGAGFSLALACDFRVLSTQAKMGQLAVRNGLIPPFGNIQRLVYTVGPAYSRHIIYTGRTLNAPESKEFGLTTHPLTEPETLLTAAQELAQRIAQAPTFAVRQAKQALEATITQGHAVGFARQEDALIACLDHADSRQIMQDFLNKD